MRSLIYGGIAQLVEHAAHIRDVYGSIPYAAIIMAECGKQPKCLWQKQFDAEVKGVLASGVRPLLLLHACCAPCTAGVLWQLADAFQIVVFYYNPNIAPREEYSRRLEELKRFLDVYPLAVQHGVTLEVEDGAYSEWEDAVGLRAMSGSSSDFAATCDATLDKIVSRRPIERLAEESERGERCRRCYAMRLRKTKEAADRLGAEYFATTLTLSPHKDADTVNACGLAVEEMWSSSGFAAPCATSLDIEAPVGLQFKTSPLRRVIVSRRPIAMATRGAKYLVSDFKKRDGFLKSLRLSAEYALYRQQYCGCECSMRCK